MCGLCVARPSMGSSNSRFSINLEFLHFILAYFALHKITINFRTSFHFCYSKPKHTVHHGVIFGHCRSLSLAVLSSYLFVWNAKCTAYIIRYASQHIIIDKKPHTDTALSMLTMTVCIRLTQKFNMTTSKSDQTNL